MKVTAYFMKVNAFIMNVTAILMKVTAQSALFYLPIIRLRRR